MNQHRRYEAEQVRSGENTPVNDHLVVEHPLQIAINGEALSVTMQTPGREIDLVRGLLHSEDLLRRVPNDSLRWQFEKNADGLIDRINLEVPEEHLRDGYMNSRQLLSVASCGICGRVRFEARSGHLVRKHESPAEAVRSAFEKLQERQRLFALTGGCHGAAVLSRDGRLLAAAEDIGRHNAVDKVIGQLLQENRLNEGQLLVVSGRVSYEIVAKCFMAGIPELAAVSAPSSLAVDFAKELGLRLMAFCRGDRMTVYS